MRYIAHPLFLQFFVPLITVGITVFLKIVSRNDRYKRFKKEDLAVGLEIAVTALILFISESANLSQQLKTYPNIAVPEMSEKLTTVPWMILVFLLGIWGVSTLVRWIGWEGDDNLNIRWGIILPDLFGLLLLFYVVNWIR